MSKASSKTQLHKRLTTEQVKSILEKYFSAELKAKEAIAYLELSRSRFYELVTEYAKEPKAFSLY